MKQDRKASGQKDREADKEKMKSQTYRYPVLHDLVASLDWYKLGVETFAAVYKYGF